MLANGLQKRGNRQADARRERFDGDCARQLATGIHHRSIGRHGRGDPRLRAPDRVVDDQDRAQRIGQLCHRIGYAHATEALIGEALAVRTDQHAQFGSRIEMRVRPKLRIGHGVAMVNVAVECAEPADRGACRFRHADAVALGARTDPAQHAIRARRDVLRNHISIGRETAVGDHHGLGGDALARAVAHDIDADAGAVLDGQRFDPDANHGAATFVKFCSSRCMNRSGPRSCRSNPAIARRGGASTFCPG